MDAVIQRELGKMSAVDESQSPSVRCYMCNVRLVPIGDSRKGGACHSDWPSRQFHKKCWREMDDDDKADYYYDRRVYIVVGYKDKDRAKDSGAKWDPDRKLWFAEDDYTYRERLSAYAVVDAETP